MPSVAETVWRIINAPTWDQRVARVRQIPAMHGTNEHTSIYADVARQLYVAHPAPDYAYVPVEDFYEFPHFDEAYALVAAATGRVHEGERRRPGSRDTRSPHGHVAAARDHWAAQE